MLSFGAFPAEVPARVRFLHPLHNFSIVSYDPRQVYRAIYGAAKALADDRPGQRKLTVSQKRLAKLWPEAAR